MCVNKWDKNDECVPEILITSRLFIAMEKCGFCRRIVYKIWSFLFTRQGKINPIMKNRVGIGYRKRVTV